MENRYFDNAATSHPKSEAVISAVESYLRHGGSYGRSAYGLSVDNTRMVERCRSLMARLIGAKSSESVIFGANATWGANAILQRLALTKGDIVYHSSMEHNCIMRPLNYLKKELGIELCTLPSDHLGMINCEALTAINWEKVKLVVVNHASNVNGIVQPLLKISTMIPQEIEFMVDTAQSLGAVEVNVEQMRIDYLIFTAHKSLGGVTGCGGFYSRKKLPSFIFGGTGSRSESYEMPEEAPDKYEAGTPNLVGIAALYAALKGKNEGGNEQKHSWSEYINFINNIRKIDGVTVYSSGQMDGVELFSFTHNKLSPSMIADKLSSEYEIAVRQGLHCAPLAHQTLGTMPEGTVRVSLSRFHSNDDLNRFVQALNTIISQGKDK